MATKRTILEDIDAYLSFQKNKNGVAPERIQVKENQFKTLVNKRYPGRKNKETEKIVAGIMKKRFFMYESVRIEIL